jgi:hypothetical protein
MKGLLRAEILKITTTRMALGLALGAAAYVALNVVALFFTAGQPQVPSLAVASSVRNLYASAGAASPFVLVLGILGMTTEYRFMTVTTTFLVTPRRGRVLAAKLAAHAVLGALVGVGCAVLGTGLAAVLLTFKAHAAISAGTLLQIAAGTVLGYALYAVLGVSVGALVRSQVAAVLCALLWVFVIEALLVAFLPSVGRWLPGGALRAALQASTQSGQELLPAWAGAALLVAYALALAALATRTTLRRDIT